jgi:hypothetical protein
MKSTKKTLNLKRPHYDKFELKIKLTGPHTSDSDESPGYLITQAILINDKSLATDNPIDLIPLAKSCQLSGEFFIVTCGCGDAGCAGIDEGIRVAHFDDRIVWEVPDPISYRGLSDEAVKRASEDRLYKKYSFEPEAYLVSVQEGLRIAKGLLFGDKQPVECSPYGMNPERLLSIDPVVFGERGASVGSQIIGRRVEIGPSLTWFTINGISYRFREFPFPEDIKALDDWSDWPLKPCGQDGLVFGDLAAPDWVLRQRVHKLANYFASISLRSVTVQSSFRGRRCEDGVHLERKILFHGRSKEIVPHQHIVNK